VSLQESPFRLRDRILIPQSLAESKEDREELAKSITRTLPPDSRP
jgi:hypothetical protein